MDNEKPLVNRVAASSLVTINLEELFPSEELLLLDLKDFLFKELLLKEKDFRQSMKDIDWAGYKGKDLAVFCSNDAIIPVWAYMLVAQYAGEYVNFLFFGDQTAYYDAIFASRISDLEISEYENKRVVIKGCSNKPVPASAYANLTARLKPFVKSIMYGEPCSTVPIYKKPREKPAVK